MIPTSCSVSKTSPELCIVVSSLASCVCVCTCVCVCVCTLCWVGWGRCAQTFFWDQQKFGQGDCPAGTKILEYLGRCGMFSSKISGTLEVVRVGDLHHV